MRTLHLLDADSSHGLPDGALVAIALLQSRDQDNEHLLACFAQPSEIRRAREFGVRIDLRLGTPAHRRRSASLRLRHHLDAFDPIDRIQPWSSLTADIALALRDLTASAPPLPLYAPLIAGHDSAETRRRCRQRLDIGNDEIVVTMLDLDTRRSSAGVFGLAVAPLTCAMQGKTIVGLIPEAHESDGAARARRYAARAGDVWRIELVSASQSVAALAADAVLCQSASFDSDPWRSYGSARYAITCAQACAVPVVAGVFDQSSPPATYGLEHTITSTKPGRVGIITALNNALSDSDQTREIIQLAKETSLEQHCPERWLERWHAARQTPETSPISPISC